MRLKSPTSLSLSGIRRKMPLLASLTIVVPARNEEVEIEAALAISSAAQLSQYQIVAVNDRFH